MESRRGCRRGLAERRPPTGFGLSIGLEHPLRRLSLSSINTSSKTGLEDPVDQDAGHLPPRRREARQSSLAAFGWGGITRPPRRGVAIHARDSRADDGPGARARCYARCPSSSQLLPAPWEPTRSATCSRSGSKATPMGATGVDRRSSCANCWPSSRASRRRAAKRGSGHDPRSRCRSATGLRRSGPLALRWRDFVTLRPGRSP